MRAAILPRAPGLKRPTAPNFAKYHLGRTPAIRSDQMSGVHVGYVGYAPRWRYHSTAENCRPERSYRGGMHEMSNSRIRAAGYDADRIRIDPSVVRGLEYYTGPVFEVELTFSTDGEDGTPGASARSAAAGDMTVWCRAFAASRCRRPDFPSACRGLRPRSKYLGKLDSKPEPGPVVVTVFDRDRIADYQNMVAKLRDGGHPRRALSRQSGNSARRSNTPTSATRPASSSRAPTKRPRARSRSRT